MKQNLVKANKTALVLVDMVAKLVVIYPIYRYAQATKTEWAYYLVTAAGAWLAAAAVVVLFKIVKAGVLAIHNEYGEK